MLRWVTYQEALLRHPFARSFAEFTAASQGVDPGFILVLINGEIPVDAVIATPQDVPAPPTGRKEDPIRVLVAAARAIMAASDMASWEKARVALQHALEGLPSGV